MARILDEEYVDRIIDMINEGMTNEEIAELLGVKPHNIQYVRGCNRNRISFSRYKGGKIAQKIILPPEKTEEDVFRTTESLLTAEKTITFGGIKTVLWYKITSKGRITIYSKDRSESLSIGEDMLHGFVEELMRLSSVVPKIKETDKEFW